MARALRKSKNLAEDSLWHTLRNRNLNGTKFYRQEPIDRYIVDFACRDLQLVVELDGSQHIDSKTDPIRNAFMNAAGWSIARFPSSDALNNREAILDTLAAIINGSITDSVLSPEFQFYPVKPMTMTTNGISHPGPLEPFSHSDTAFMRRAIALTRPGKTWPNPSVGCVIVKDGTIIAEATTGDGGRPHAEELALATAGDVKGATAYVTLEPCGCRSTGAPSCSQRLVEAGITRVVYACEDPSPFASHAGPQRLKSAGITTQSGLLSDEAAHLIAPTAYFHTTGRPLIEAGSTPDGFDAEFTPATGDLTAELMDWAARGYRHLYVARGSELAQSLRQLGYLTE